MLFLLPGLRHHSMFYRFLSFQLSLNTFLENSFSFLCFSKTFSSSLFITLVSPSFTQHLASVNIFNLSISQFTILHSPLQATGVVQSRCLRTLPSSLRKTLSLCHSLSVSYIRSSTQRLPLW